jgi:16S rRNA (cytosine1402-N4)-methyltransferase
MKYHNPVMLDEVIKYLRPAPQKRFIDATLGDGGHSVAFLKAGAQVLGLDVHQPSLQKAAARVKEEGLAENFIGTVGNFKDLGKIAEEQNFDRVDGIIFDLGYSSSQLEEDLGISFMGEQPLDMRLDSSLGVTAADLLNTLPEKELAKLISEYGGERLAKKFAKEIVKFRNLKKFQTTRDLSDLLESAAPLDYEHGRIRPATRTFQALRIVVNDEIENLKKALPEAARLLLPGGRMAIISFHSLEDKVAKDFGTGVQPKLKSLVKKPLTPSREEIKENVRSRSAKLRLYERPNKESKKI